MHIRIPRLMLHMVCVRVRARVCVGVCVGVCVCVCVCVCRYTLVEACT